MQQNSVYSMIGNFSSLNSRMPFQNMSAYMPTNVSSWPNGMVSAPNVQAPPIPFESSQGPAMVPSPSPPVSVALYGPTCTSSWAHTVPSLMPWAGTESGAVPTDPVIRFTAPFYPPDPCTSQTATSWELLNNLGSNKTTVNVHLKRKSELDVPETAPQKMCITEDRMAARLKALHISNRYQVPSEMSPFSHADSMGAPGATERSVTNLQQLEAMLKESESTGSLSAKSLILAPEIKKLVEPEKIFANTFLDKIERPSMAVVVWQPQNSMLPGCNNNEEKKPSSESETSTTVSLAESNNNLISPQLNTVCNQSLPFSQAENSASEEVMDT